MKPAEIIRRKHSIDKGKLSLVLSLIALGIFLSFATESPISVAFSWMGITAIKLLLQIFTALSVLFSVIGLISRRSNKKIAGAALLTVLFIIAFITTFILLLDD